LSLPHRGGIHLLPVWIFLKCVAAKGEKSLSSLDIGKLIPKAVWLLEPIKHLILVLGGFICASLRKEILSGNAGKGNSQKRFPQFKAA
jgi:hypothetical protein